MKRWVASIPIGRGLEPISVRARAALCDVSHDLNIRPSNSDCPCRDTAIAEAHTLLAKWGRNELAEKRKSRLKILIEQARSGASRLVSVESPLN